MAAGAAYWGGRLVGLLTLILRVAGGVIGAGDGRRGRQLGKEGLEHM